MSKSTSAYSEKNNFIDSIGYLIVYLMVGLIPHIYKYTLFTPAESESIYFKEPMYADLYILAKSRVFLFLTILLLGVFVYQLSKKNIFFIKDKITFGTGIFAVVVILSSVISEYQDIVYFGAKDRFEGMWIWLAYLVVFTIARQYGRNKDFVEKLLNVFLFSASIMALFGIMQVFGYDIYTEGPVKWLSFPPKVAAEIGKYMVLNDSKVLSVGALYNSNYFGVYSSLATMIAVVKILENNPSRKTNSLYGLLVIVNYLAVFTSRSEAALLGLLIAISMLILAQGELLRKKVYVMGTLMTIIVLIQAYVSKLLIVTESLNSRYIYVIMFLILIVSIAARNVIFRFDKLRKGLCSYSKILAILILVMIISVVNAVFLFPSVNHQTYSIKDIAIDKNSVEIVGVDNQNMGFEFFNEGITISENDEIITNIAMDNDEKVELHLSSTNIFVKITLYSNGYLLSINGPFDINFFYDGNKVNYVDKMTGMGNLDTPKKIEYYYSNGKTFSSRGYIWSVYVPMILDNPLLGYGSDTFVMNFPQRDFIGKYNNFGDGNMIVDKPHSFYIGLAFSFGCIPFLLAMFIVYKLIIMIVNSILAKDKINKVLLLMIIILVSNIFNDSTIPITILMMILLGIAINKDEVETNVLS